MKIKKSIFFIVAIVIFSCCSREIKEEKMVTGYTDDGKYYVDTKDRVGLRTDYSYYGLRMDSNYSSRKLENIYLYDGINGIKYSLKNINALKKIVNENLPEGITVYYYEFCTTGSGLKYYDEQNILLEINSIFKNNSIKFIYKDENIYPMDSELWEYKLDRIGICTCLGG